MRQPITSRQNKHVKNVVKLRQRRQRDAQQLMLVEGVREIRQALASQLIPVMAFVCPPLLNGEGERVTAALRQLSQTHHIPLLEVTPPVYAKMAVRGQSGGLLLVLPYLRHTLADLSGASFLAVVDGGEKPGNLGAILRVADAAGVDGVIVTEGEAGGTDIHNPNVVRASLGALFTLPVAAASTAEAIVWLRQAQISIIAATPDAETRYTAVNLTRPVALAVGSEAFGLSQAWLAAADEKVTIPMRGVVDSLNLAAATAVLLYEVVRQRSALSLPKAAA